MEKEASETWQAVVLRYLDACTQDIKSRYENGPGTSVAAFLGTYASENVSASYRAKNARMLALIVNPPGVAQWKIIRETDQDVLVEIPPPEKTSSLSIAVPFASVRILLMRSSSAWKIYDILDACIKCNLDRSPDSNWNEGDCRFCHGSGAMVHEPCRLCGASGKCRHCHSEAMPGWLRSASLHHWKIENR